MLEKSIITRESCGRKALVKFAREKHLHREKLWEKSIIRGKSCEIKKIIIGECLWKKASSNEKVCVRLRHHRHRKVFQRKSSS